MLLILYKKQLNNLIARKINKTKLKSGFKYRILPFTYWNWKMDSIFLRVGVTYHNWKKSSFVYMLLWKIVILLIDKIFNCILKKKINPHCNFYVYFCNLIKYVNTFSACWLSYINTFIIAVSKNML